MAVPLQDEVDPQNIDQYRVVLYIDGFIVRIQRPDHAGDSYFCGRHGKSCDSLNVQYVTDKWGRIRHVITGLSGSTHDKTAASWSIPLRQFFDALPDGFVVLGDAAAWEGDNTCCEQQLDARAASFQQRLHSNSADSGAVNRRIGTEVESTAVERQPHCGKEKCRICVSVHAGSSGSS